MGALLTAFNAVLPLFLVIFAGILFSRSKTASEIWVSVLNNYALKVGLPALVIASLIKIDPTSGNYGKLILINSAWFIICMLLAFPVARLFKLNNNLRSALIMVFSYGNVAYLGIPVLKNSYGEMAVPVAGIISSIYIFWLLTLGMFFIELNHVNRPNIGKLLLKQSRNPLMLSVFIGLSIVVFKIRLPGFISETIGLFAGSVTAVVLFSLGIFLGFHKAGGLKDWGIALLWSVVIMVILPAVFYFFAGKSSLDNLSLKASVLEVAMPLGLTPYAIASQNKIETPLIARIVVTSTLGSIIVIPLWIIILG